MKILQTKRKTKYREERNVTIDSRRQREWVEKGKDGLLQKMTLLNPE